VHIAQSGEGQVRQAIGSHRGNQVANLAAVSTLDGRSAIRAAAQAFGWEDAHIDVLQRRVHAEQPLDRHEQMVHNAAKALDGQPAHVLRHASGVIVTDAPSKEVHGVADHVDGPLLLMDKDDAEALQVLKFDLLPWYVLALYDQAERTIHAAHYPSPDL
jgi:DNA polymerase III alpha subunit